MASVPVYCLCGQPYDASRFMIQCDVCREWFHGSCVNFKEHQAEDIDKYHCPKCTKIFGPSICKQRTNWHRHDYCDKDADTKAVQTGTPVFMKELKTRHFQGAESIIINLHGDQLDLSYVIQHGFNSPIYVEQKDGLGLFVPSDSEFSPQQVEALVGSDREVDVIDVGKQDTLRMNMRDFVESFTNLNRTKILNLIGLEFSDTKLSELVEAPTIVRQLTWMNKVWPRDETTHEKPQVEKYCLMGMKDSYTDFHIDFGGTSVWYHVLKGEKVFFFIPPTAANLSLYEQWMSSSNQSETFFGDQVDACYRFVLKQGSTLIIPTGWIHAVFTPVDSLVFGGNFLHDHSIPLQLQIYELEKRIKTPGKYRFPSYETVTWYAARYALEQLMEFNRQQVTPPPYLLLGVKALITTLRSWTQSKEFAKHHKALLPLTIQHGKLIKDLNKELKQTENQGIIPPLDDIPPLSPPPPPIPPPPSTTVVPETKPSAVTTKKQHNLRTPPPTKSDAVFTPPLAAKTSSPTSPFALWVPKTTTSPDSKPTALKVKLQKSNARRNNNKAAPYPTTGGKKNAAGGGGGGGRNANKKGAPPAAALNADSSVYEFRDSDDEALVVDENPPPARARLVGKGGGAMESPEKQGPLKLRLSCNKKTKKILPQQTLPDGSDGNDDDPNAFAVGSNSGIEELLRASGYTTDTECKLEDELGNGRASPSTREAIQGMLSIGCAVQFSTLTAQSNSGQRISGGSSKGLPNLRKPQQRQKKFILSDDVGDNMEKCHQDEEYVYPTLDLSDDEIHIFKPRGRVKRDEAWNPKGAKLVPNCPKPERPVREGVKKESVESGLAAAAAKLAHMPNPKRPYHRKKAPPPKAPKIEEPKTLPSTSSPSTSSSSASALSSGKKPKKGMATAKQRLGRILKIHKMLH